METAIGANMQEPAAPAGFEESAPPRLESENSAGAAARQEMRGESGPMPPEDRSAARSARLRERAEGEARLRAALERQDAYARERGYADFNAMARAEAPARPVAPQAGALEAELRAIVDRQLSQNPVLEAARQAAETAAVEDSRRSLEGEMREFLATPEYAKSGIRGFADLTAMPGWDRFYDLVANRGLSLSDAYELVNRPALLRDRAEAARQAALNSVYGKDHLTGGGGAEGAGGAAVPADVMDWYRQMNPNMTGRQIAEHYAAFLRRQDEP